MPALLRRLADQIEQHGIIEVQDLVLHLEIDDDGEFRPLVTVYFHEEDPDEA